MVRQRSSAVRYPSKEAADGDKLLVKANRTLHVDVCVSSTSTTKTAQNVATAVGVQGWRKTMEDAHVVWLRKNLKDDGDNNSNNNQKNGRIDDNVHATESSSTTTIAATSSSRYFRSFICGPVDTEHHQHHHNTSTGSKMVLLHNQKTSTNNTGTNRDEDSHHHLPSTRECSPAPAEVVTSSSSNYQLQQPTTNPLLFSSPSVAQVMNSFDVDLLADPYLLPNNSTSSNLVPNPAAACATSSPTPSTKQTQQLVADGGKDGATTTTVSHSQGQTVALSSSSSPTNNSNHGSQNNNTNNSSNKTNEQVGLELDLLAEGTSIQGFVAVFDGHGGDLSSKFCASRLGALLFEEIADLEKKRETTFSQHELQQAFNRAFLTCDDQLRNHFAALQGAAAAVVATGGENSPADADAGAEGGADEGTAAMNANPSFFVSPLSPLNTTHCGNTAAGALVMKEQIVLFSVGDCRSAVFQCHSERKSSHADDEGEEEHTRNNNNNNNNNNSCNGRSATAATSSWFSMLGKLDDDHRPGASTIEKERLERIGASVINGRVGGKLSVSRAFGDFAFKMAPTEVSANPDDDPLLQYPVVCIPELRIISTAGSPSTPSGSHDLEPLLIAVGCDGVFETQELSKLPDLVLFTQQQHDHHHDQHHHHHPHEEEIDCASSPSPSSSTTATATTATTASMRDADDRETQNFSTIVLGTVRVAQRSISTSQPISAENGGLLPGSDNVTFISVLLHDYGNQFFATRAAVAAASSGACSVDNSPSLQTPKKSSPCRQSAGMIDHPHHHRNQDRSEKPSLAEIVSATEPLSPAMTAETSRMVVKGNEREEEKGPTKLVLSPSEKTHHCC